MTQTGGVGLESPHSVIVLGALRRMASNNRLRTSTLMDRVALKLSLTQLDISEALRDLHRCGLLNYQADNRGLPVSGFIGVVPTEVTQAPHALAWTDSLQRTGFSNDAVGVLMGLAPKLTDLSPDDMDQLAKALKLLEKREKSHFDDAGFNVSARQIMGSSKVLAEMTQRMLQVLRIPARMHYSSPRYVICAGPANPKTTLLIENPRAFENAVRSGLADTVALACTYGFGLSYIGQDWLQADIPDLDRPIVIPRSGSPLSLGELLGAEKVFLWADLDRSAFDIYKSLQRSVPHIRLSGIYHAMVPLLANPGSSHPYCAMFQKDGQATLALTRVTPTDWGDDEAARKLWSLCAIRAVDQEAVLEPDIVRLGNSNY